MKTRPRLLLTNIPEHLRRLERWVVWRDKVPYRALTPAKKADVSDPATWAPLHAAVRAYERDATLGGIGYVLYAPDQLIGLDLDHALDERGALHPRARDILARVRTFTERSPSGRGLHLLGRGTLPAGHPCRFSVDGLGIEIYTTARFFTVTTERWADAPEDLENIGEAVQALLAELAPDSERRNGHVAGDGAVNGHTAAPPLTDDEVLALARGAANRDKFLRLWAGDTNDYDHDDSRADLALVSLLAFYTRDPAQLDRLFRRSGLMRPKWLERHAADGRTYGQLTIDRALATVRECWSPGGPELEIAGDGEPLDAETDEDLASDHAAAETAGSTGQAPRRGPPSTATLLVRLALQVGIELFHDPAGDPYARLRVEDHTETHPLRSKAFRRWLAQAYWCATRQALKREALGDALGVLEAEAQFHGGERTVYTRVAPDGLGGVYLDLADAAWRAVHVTAGGWQLVADPPVAFRRAPGTLPLPTPLPGGDLAALRQLANLRDDSHWALAVAWLVAALYPRGPYPCLGLRGEQGSAKTTCARLLRALVDPATPDLRAEPTELRDLMITARGSWIVALDNLSHLPVWLSDALCRLATGSGFATRELYSDTDEVIFTAQRPVLWTAIDLPLRDDLADRAVLLDLPAIAEAERRTEAALWARFEALRPQLLGALLDRLAGALRELPATRLDRLPRMADFAVLAVAAERAAGEPARFLAAYSGQRHAAYEAALEASAVGQALVALVREQGAWEGTAAELLAALAAHAGEAATRARGWPRSARALVGELRRLAPALRAVGITYIPARRVGHDRARRLRLEPTPEPLCGAA